MCKIAIIAILRKYEPEKIYFKENKIPEFF